MPPAKRQGGNDDDPPVRRKRQHQRQGGDDDDPPIRRKRQREGADDDDPPIRSAGATVGQQTSFIKNKQVRSERYAKLKAKAKKVKTTDRKKRDKEAAQAEKLGLEPAPKRIPKTLENTREKDETMVKVDDAEVAADEEQDEFAEHFRNERPPKVMLTTCFKPSGKMYVFLSEMLASWGFKSSHSILTSKNEVLPCAEYYKRSGTPLKKIVKYATARDFTDILVFNEDRKKMNGLVMIHLPDGPTATFRLSNLVLGRDIKNHGRATEHKPELILNNFDTRIGHRIGRMIGSLFHQDPQFRGRRVATFHNQRDFIFFRHHRYIFEEKEKKRAKDTPTKVVNARLQELGPRFTLKLQGLQKGTFDTKTGEYEWLREKASKDASRRKFNL